jgi:hypothetical protein
MIVRGSGKGIIAEASSKFARKFLVIPKQQRKRPAFPCKKKRLLPDHQSVAVITRIA